MPHSVSTANVPKARYIHYWRNAEECFAGMQDAAQHQRWHLTALNGIHCVIAAADALLVYTVGLRCTSRDHLDVFVLLARHLDAPDRDSMLKHGSNVVRKKTDIEYRAQPISQADAQQMMKQVERFYEWVRKQIEPVT